MEELTMSKRDLEILGNYVQDHLVGWIIESKAALYLAQMGRDYENSLTERIVRVEEALKHQGDLIEKILHQMDMRFQQVDKRFEQMQINMDKRFEQVDKHFEEMRIDMDKRFDQMRLDMNQRFDQVDRRFRQMFAYFTTAFVIIGALAVVYPVFT